MDNPPELDAVKRWLDAFVVDMRLCPFAAAPLAAGKVRFTVTPADTREALLLALHQEFEALDADDEIETSLLIHPHVLQRFEDYNQFLDLADALLVDAGCEGIYQVASFHPEYQFADTAPDAAENYTNRSPHPLLHILREESVSRAIESDIDTDAVPERNIRHMQTLGEDALRARLAACLAASE